MWTWLSNLRVFTFSLALGKLTQKQTRFRSKLGKLTRNSLNSVELASQQPSWRVQRIFSLNQKWPVSEPKVKQTHPANIRVCLHSLLLCVSIPIVLALVVVLVVTFVVTYFCVFVPIIIVSVLVVVVRSVIWCISLLFGFRVCLAKWTLVIWECTAELLLSLAIYVREHCECICRVFYFNWKCWAVFFFNSILFLISDNSIF